MQVQYDAENQRWDLTWQDLLLRLRLMEATLVCEYFGAADQVAPIATWARYLDTLRLTRSAASVQLTGADWGIQWALHSWLQPEWDSLVISLQAADLPLKSNLRFVADEDTGLLRCQTTLSHNGDGPPLDISGAVSVSVLLPSDVEETVHLAGRWGAETQVQRLSLPESALLLESRAGKTGFDFSPYAALLAPDHTYLCELLWSGNWQLHIRRRPDGLVTLAGGVNDWGFRHRLHPDDHLELPAALLACVPGDLNVATQRLHDYHRRHLRPDSDRPVPVQFNSWYPYPGEPPVETMKSFATTAAELGCEVFVLDAGWYTTETEDPAESWWSRTGDWIVNRRLFPDGLEDLSAYCQDRGLGFGIWFEPEAVSPNAQIRRTHPDWLHFIEGAPLPPSGERGIVHLGVPEARTYIRERILDILRKTGAIWMKWDFNTDLLQGGWAPGLPETLTDKDPLVAHYQGLYQLQDELRAAMPDLTLEMCAGGGGRFDPNIMSHAHTNWMSDQTQSLMNLAIHFGSQLAHPAVECNDWLIEWPPHDGLHGRQTVDERGDLAFRTRVAMLGTFGISAPVEQWTPADKDVVITHITWYKSLVRPVVHWGGQYFLTDAPPLDGEGDWAAVWYLSKDRTRGVLFAFRLASSEGDRSFALPGLLPDARYRLTSPEGLHAEASGTELSEGLIVSTEAPFRSVLIAVERT